jgi:stage II sporulation protein P
LVRFKVIRIRSKIIPFVAICLLISIVISFFIMPRIKPKTAVVFNQLKIDKPHIKTPSNLDYIFSKKILSLGLPALDTFEKQKVRLFNLASIPTTAMKLLTNIDINKPESFFALQVPLMSLMKTETTLTPGVEVPQDGDSNLIEDEHNPPEDPPEVPSMELDSKEVDKLVTEQGKPILLIYHTHTSESYTPSKAYNYNPRDNAYHTEDLNFSIAKVGEAMAAELNMLKVPTLHDKTIHDIPTYMTSYTNSLKTVEKIIKQHPTIKIIIDLHRDAPFTDSNKSRELTTVKIEGETYSRIMFVIGSDKTFPHPNWQENYKFSLLFNDMLEEKYPGISRGINLRRERFNQHVSNKAILVEIGSHGNTMEESIRTAKLFASILSDLIKELTE